MLTQSSRSLLQSNIQKPAAAFSRTLRRCCVCICLHVMQSAPECCAPQLRHSAERRSDLSKPQLPLHHPHLHSIGDRHPGCLFHDPIPFNCITGRIALVASVISLTALVQLVIPTHRAYVTCVLVVGVGEGVSFIPGHPGTRSGNLACWNH